MNRRQLLVTSVAAASASILPKAVAAAPAPISVTTPAEHMALRPAMYARPVFVAVRAGEEPTKAAWVERVRRAAGGSVMKDYSYLIEITPESRMLFVDCGNLSPAAARRRLQDVKMKVEAGIPFEIANQPPKLASGAPAW